MGLGVDGMLRPAHESTVFKKVVALGDLFNMTCERAAATREEEEVSHLVGHRRKRAFILYKPD